MQHIAHLLERQDRDHIWAHYESDVRNVVMNQMLEMLKCCVKFRVLCDESYWFGLGAHSTEVEPQFNWSWSGVEHRHSSTGLGRYSSRRTRSTITAQVGRLSSVKLLRAVSQSSPSLRLLPRKPELNRTLQGTNIPYLLDCKPQYFPKTGRVHDGKSIVGVSEVVKGVKRARTRQFSQRREDSV
jgi:hypothetical protein